MTPNLFNGRTMMKWIIAMIGVGLFAACDDDDGDVIDTPSAETLEILQSDEYAFQIVCAGLFNAYDSLYTMPAVGEALDETQPTVYATGVADEAAARSFFDNLCTVADRCTSLTDGSIQYDLGTYGNLCYRPSGENGALASLEVNLHEVTSLTRLDFISQDLWPNNDVSLFELGDIVKDTAWGYTWVCVQEYGAGLPALFITFDTSKLTMPYGYTNLPPSSPKYYFVYRQCASYESLKAWYNLLHMGKSRFTVGTTESAKLINIDIGLNAAVEKQNEPFYTCYCSGTCLERNQITKNILCQDVLAHRYHIIAMSDECGVPVAADLIFLCAYEWGNTTTMRDLIDVPNDWNPYHLQYMFHTGIVEYLDETWAIQNQTINKQTLSISLQNVQLMQKMFTKVDL
jgi:hypothetical protein